MKAETKNTQQSKNSKHQASPTLSPASCFWIFALAFSLRCPSTSCADQPAPSEKFSPPASSMLRPTDTAPDANVVNLSHVPTGQSTDLRRHSWQARLTTPGGQEYDRSKRELRRIIEQVRSVEFQAKKDTADTVTVVGPPSAAEPNESLPFTQAPAETTEDNFKPKPTCEPVTDQTLKMLEALLQHPERLENPLKLGEILFLSGNTKEAAMLYKEALSRRHIDDARSVRDRAWILFQTGNCLQDIDPLEAKNMYQRLIIEHPASLWMDLAKARSEQIDWYRQDKPAALIKDSREATPLQQPAGTAVE